MAAIEDDRADAGDDADARAEQQPFRQVATGLEAGAAQQRAAGPAQPAAELRGGV